jgi:ribonuclease G
MATELIINASLPETRIALTEDGEIQELLIERASGKGIVGNIYKGRVTRVLPGMQAAFVDIGLEKAAFLYVDDVYVHSDIFDEEEGESSSEGSSETQQSASAEEGAPTEGEASASESGEEGAAETASEMSDADAAEEEAYAAEEPSAEGEEDEGDGQPMAMDLPPGGEGEDEPAGTVAPESSDEGKDSEASEGEGGDVAVEGAPAQAGGAEGEDSRRRRHRRGRRGGRNRRGERDRSRERAPNRQAAAGGQEGGAHEESSNEMPDSFQENMGDGDQSGIERPSMEEGVTTAEGAEGGRPTESQGRDNRGVTARPAKGKRHPEFNEQRGRDRRVRSKPSLKPVRGQVNIQDLLQEGQEVIVQVAKDPIATKGARLTCHISLPGRHLVCMPTIDHVGVSRRIERDDERRRLRDFVERARPKKLGFIVRTASGKSAQSEKRIKQDVDYLTRLWDEIRDRASQVSAPALVYEDLNSVLRAIRDWVTEEIDKIVVDSRYHHQEILKFVSHFMPSLRQKVELYHGDIPIFDAYGISTELSRSLERKVWLKSGGYIVVDQAEALVAIDVNTGRYVGKRSLEDTILKTNLEAVQEIAYQLRLRNCGGIIILDLIDMEKEENKQRVYRALEDALRKDRARPTILKISELGLVEMTRKRTRDTIIRTLCEPCNHCEGKGFVKSKQTVAYEVMREIEREGLERGVNKILIRAHADVIDILAIDERDTMDALEKRYRKQIFLQAVGDFHQEQFEVLGDIRLAAQQQREQEKREREENSRDEGSAEASSGDGEQREGGRRDSGHRNDRDRNRGRDRDRGRGRDRDRNRDRDREQQPREASPDRPAPRQIVITNPGAYVPQQPKEQPVIAQQPEGEPGNAAAPIAQARAPAVEDESFGNRVDYQPAQSADAPPPSNDPYEEEDRLAFLRAQAAQDAALAMYGANGQPGQPGAQNRGGGQGRWAGGGGGGSNGQNRDRGGRGGGRNRRGGRGGRDRHGGGGRFGDRDRGPRMGGGNGNGGVVSTDRGGRSDDTDGSQPPAPPSV